MRAEKVYERGSCRYPCVVVSHLLAPSATTIVKFTITSPSMPRPIHHPTLALSSLSSLLSLPWDPRRRRPPLPLPSSNHLIAEPRIALTLPTDHLLARQLLVTQATLPLSLTLARVVPPAAALIPQPLLRLRLLLLYAELALEDVGMGMGMGVRVNMSVTLSIPVRVRVMALCQRMSVAGAVAVAVRMHMS